METNAKIYSSLNKPQYDVGCDFIRTLSLSAGDKVLDMGCGTGELSKFIADIVGLDGEVVGVDPDEARVKLAQEKFKDVPNIKFLVGSSVTGFPHDNEQYYDVHFSNYAFHWVTGDEKRIYVEKAYQCLKSGGRIAIQALVKSDVKFDAKIAIERLSEEDYKDLLRGVGLFSEIGTEKVRHTAHLSSFEEFAAWVKASTHHDLKEVDQGLVKDFLTKFARTEADGTFSVEIKDLVRITGKRYNQ